MRDGAGLVSGFRQFALSQVDPLSQPIPPHPTVAFVWPTELCSIGCAHCSFGARRSGPQDKRRIAESPETLVEWLANAGVKRLVVCGGGEPLDEPEFIERAILASAKRGIPIEIYTSGVSLIDPQPIEQTILRWEQARTSTTNPLPFSVRLSVDRFHEERVGLEKVVEWIRAIEKLVPHWRISLRGVRLIGDDSIDKVAVALGGKLKKGPKWTGWLTTVNGRQILVEWKGFVIEKRGSLSLLSRRGLSLPDQDRELLASILGERHKVSSIGRPLSVRLTVTHRRLDLEIHAAGTVNILESQAHDLRMNLFETQWREMRQSYYRDPLLHQVITNGLPGIAELLRQALELGIPSGEIEPYSLQNLTDPAVLEWATAAAILRNSPKFLYPAELSKCASDFLENGRPVSNESAVCFTA